jgi:glycosyltransferase involved in cell wall biosynthesis
MKGDPAIVLLGGGWLPNRDSIRWFFESIWSRVREENPGAHAHVFGADRPIRQPSTTSRPSPEDSQEIFHEDAVLVVPLRIASGIRMKIIEAWARGVPVVATPEAVKGLDVLDQGEAILAKNAAEFASAIRRLREDPGLRERLVETGRRNLVRQFDPARISSELEEAYATAISSFTAQGSDGSKSPS